MKILVISDTHGSIPPALLLFAAEVELVLHLGDVGQIAVLDQLSASSAVLAVAGNTDSAGSSLLPDRRDLDLGGWHLKMRHLPWQGHEINAAGLWLHGHTHKPALGRVGDGWRLCPGAINGPRGGSPPSCVLMELETGEISAHFVDLRDGSFFRSEKIRA